MPEHPEASAPRYIKKFNAQFQFFAHPAIYLVSCLLMLWWFYWLYKLLPFMLPLLPTFIIFLAPLVLGQIGMVRKRHYVQAIFAFLLIPALIYALISIPESASNAQWRKREPAMVLLADTVLHDPKYANTKGTVVIPLPENLSKFSNGKPLRADFSRHHKGSCRIYCFWYDTASDENFYCIYESDPHNYILSDGDEYIGNIRKNFHLKPAN